MDHLSPCLYLLALSGNIPAESLDGMSMFLERPKNLPINLGYQEGLTFLLYDVCHTLREKYLERLGVMDLELN